MARGLDEILRELDASYSPQRQSIQTRMDALPAQADAEISGLKATQENAFGDILSGARSRGLGFSGIPLGEQAKYTASTFLPAVARVRTAQNESRMSLTDALNNLGLEQNRYAQTLRQSELDRDEQARQFNESLAEQRRQAAAAAKPSFGGLFDGGGAPQAAAGAKIQQRPDKGFNFQDAVGRSISAAQYAQLKRIPFRSLLDQMARSGDSGAKQALGYVGNDFGYNAAKIGNNAGLANLINSLLWGVNTVKPRGGPITLSGSVQQGGRVRLQ